LLAILAGAERQTVSRSQLRSILWGDFDREKASANLRQLIARIHKVERKFGLSLLALESDTLGLSTAHCTIDYSSFLAAVSVSHETEGSGGGCAALVRTWQGPLLAGIALGEAAADEWLENARQQAVRRFLDAARRALEATLHAAEMDGAWELALKVIEIDATEEAAYRAMMRICIARGDRGLALRIFERCKQAIGEELGVAPSRPTLDLAGLLRYRERAQPAATPASRASSPTPRAEATPAQQTGRQIPVVMVLPPATANDDASRALAGEIAEDITVGLTRFRRFTIVAPQNDAPVRFDGKSLAGALKVLDVDYAVALSLRSAAHGHRFGVRLTDMSNAEALWATSTDFTQATLDGPFERLIGLTVRSLVNAIDEREVRAPMTGEQASAYRYYLEGKRLLHRTDLQAIRRARKMFKEAIALLPSYPAALIGLARTMIDEWLVRGMVEDDLLKESIALASRAAALDPFDGHAMRERGHANLYLHRHDESLESFEEAIRLNPHDADILADYADALAHSGDPQRGLSFSQQAIGLNPVPPDDYVWTLGSIYYQLGDYRAALEALRPMEHSPATARILTACASQSGDTELARRYSRTLRSVYPKFEVENVRNIVPNRHRSDTEHLIDGLKLAGLA